jgi:hypothetical protein
MGKLRRYNSPKHLSSYGYYILDDDPNSKAFVLAQVPEVLTIGKNAFLINGSEFLIPTTEILIELTDVNGDVVFSHPIKNYQEGLARVISIEVYDDTPLGMGLLTIMGELAVDFNGNPIPPKYANTYNVKWQKQISINPFKSNTTPIRLYNEPNISLLEIENPSRKVAGVTTTFSGSSLVTGTPGLFYNGNYKNSYALKFADGANVKELVDGVVMISVNGVPYTSSVDSILNSSVLYVVTPFTSSNTGLPAAFTSNTYTRAYPAAPYYSYSPFNESFIQVTLTDLTTFAGDLRRVKLFIKGTDTDVDYKQISDTTLNPTQLLTTFAHGQTAFNYGYFTSQSVINEFWGVMSGSGATLTYSSTNLLDALQVTPGAIFPFSFAPVISSSLVQGYEYHLKFNAFCSKTDSSTDAKLDVYVYQNSDTLYIGSIVCAKGATTQYFLAQEYDFSPRITALGYVAFVVNSGTWSISDVIFENASWPGFSPDQATIQVPIDGSAYRYRNVTIRAELYDINNNFIPSNNFIVESDPLLITGSNAAIQGLDNKITGTLMVAQSGSGAVLGSDISGSYIGLQGGITSASLPRPVNPFDLVTYIGAPVITMFSGSDPFIRSTTSGSAMGFQITSGTPSGSFLSYDTITGTLLIRGDITLLPGTSLSSSIVSGSSGGDGTTALNQLQKLVSGNLLGGTYLTGRSIVSPNIGGTTGYFSTQFGVGNVAANNGIVLTALGYTGSDGVPVTGSPAIYIGQGTVGNVNTPFLVASSSAGPVFSLGNQFVYSAGSGFITMTGSLSANIVAVNTLLTSLNSNLYSINAGTINITGSLTSPVNNFVDVFVTDDVIWTHISGSVTIGPYNITQTNTATQLIGTSSVPYNQLFAASASLLYTGSAHGENDSASGFFVNTNGSASYNSQYTITIPWQTFESDSLYTSWTTTPYAKVNLYYNTASVPDSTQTTLISSNNVSITMNSSATSATSSIPYDNSVYANAVAISTTTRTSNNSNATYTLNTSGKPAGSGFYSIYTEWITVCSEAVTSTFMDASGSVQIFYNTGGANTLASNDAVTVTEFSSISGSLTSSAYIAGSPTTINFIASASAFAYSLRPPETPASSVTTQVKARVVKIDWTYSTTAGNSWNTGTIQTTVTINSPTFNIVAANVAATDIGAGSGGNLGTTVVKTNAKVSNVAWSYQTGSNQTSGFKRYGLSLNASPSGNDPHIHLNAVYPITASALTAGDIWFETSASVNGVLITQASGSLKYFDGTNIFQIGATSSIPGPQGTQGPQGVPGPSGSIGPSGSQGIPGSNLSASYDQSTRRATFQIIANTNLAPSASQSGSTDLQAYGLDILTVSASAAARFRLYGTAAYRDADAARPRGTDPVSGLTGIITEIFFPSSSLINLTPIAAGVNLDTSVNNNYYWNITNYASVSSSISMSIIRRITEQ